MGRLLVACFICIFTEPPMASPSSFAESVLLICTAPIRSRGDYPQIYLAHLRVRPGNEDTVHGGVAQARLGAAICTYCASPSLICTVTPGMRPRTVATLALGRFWICWSGHHVQDVRRCALLVDGRHVTLQAPHHHDLLVGRGD